MLQNSYDLGQNQKFLLRRNVILGFFQNPNFLFLKKNAFDIFNNFVYSFTLAGVSDPCCLDFSPSWASRGYSPVAVFGLLICFGSFWVHGFQ